MKITENFMLGTNSASVNSKVAYKSIHKDKLNPIICVKWNQPDSILSFSQFAIGNVEAWSPVFIKTKDLIKTSSEPIKHKIYNKDEIEFLLAYEEYKKLDLDLLLKLSEEHSRCTFVVKEKEFLDLFSELANFSGNFKYIHKKQVFNDLTGINSNYILLVSFYDMNTFMFDLYGKKPKGLGISFEFLNKKQSNTFPYVYLGIYLLLTNEYEGIFYKDGQVQLTVNNVDFKTSYENIKHVITTASSEQNEKILSPTINFGHQEDELITNNGFERTLKVIPRKKKKLKINYSLNSSYQSGSKKVSSPHIENIFKKHTLSHKVKKSKHIPPRLKSKKISTDWSEYSSTDWSEYSFDTNSTISVSITSDTNTNSTTY